MVLDEFAASSPPEEAAQPLVVAPREGNDGEASTRPSPPAWAALRGQRWAGADASPGIVIPAPKPSAGPGDPGKEAA